MAQADSLESVSRFGEAGAIYRRIQESYPRAGEDPQFRFKKARSLFRSVEYLTFEERQTVIGCLDSLLRQNMLPVHRMEMHRIIGQIYFESEKFGSAAEHFLTALEDTTGNADPELMLKTGYCLKESGMPLQCATVLSRSSEDTLLDVYKRFCTGQAYFLADSMEAAIRELDRLLKNYPRTHLRVRTRKYLADAYFGKGDYTRAEREYRTVFRNRRARSIRPEIQYRLGEISLRQDQRERAVGRLTAVMQLYPESDWALDAKNLLDSLGIDGEETAYYRGMVLAEHGRYDDALAAYRAFQEAYPKSPRLPGTEYLTAKAHFRKKEPATALKIFRRFLHAYPDHALTASARLYVARCLRDLEDADGALEEYEKFARMHPRHQTAAEALWYTAWMYETDGDMTQAVRNYRLVRKKFGSTRYAWEAGWREGLCLYKNGDYIKARDLFARLPHHGDIYQRDKAAFWAAKCRQALGDSAAASAAFRRVAADGPRTFYAVRAAERTGGKDEAVLPAGGYRDDFDPVEAYLKQLDSLALRQPFLRDNPDILRGNLNYLRGERLLSLGFNDEGVRELYQIEKRLGSDPAVLYRLARLYIRYRIYHRAYRVCYRMLGNIHNGDTDVFPLHDLRLLYPPAYYREIVSLCRTRYPRVDPFLVMAVMHQESRFNPGVVSPAGARGLLQLIPPTAEDMAARTGIGDFKSDMLTEPGLNLLLGTGYLDGLLKKYHGVRAYAAAAYNAGPEKVDVWILKPGIARDADLFPEEAEFSETRKYIRAVLRNYRLYHELWQPFCIRPHT